MWKWDNGREILVGHTDGTWAEQSGHNIERPYFTRLARSVDGGRSWTGETPENFVREDNVAVPSPGNIHFGHPDFALRDATTGYHGTNDTGATWGEQIVVRENPLDQDIGYPQLLQNNRGEMVALYYFASKERPHSYIEAAIWKPQ